MTVRRALCPSEARGKARAKALAPAALALALAAVAPLAATTPARAQFFGGWGGWDNGGTWDGLEPQQVRRALGQRGFRVLAPLRRNGNVFVADVLDQRGQHERLIVAAADAQILQRFMVDDGRQPGAFPRGTDDGRDFTARGGDDDRGLVPPGSIPDGANGGRRFARPGDRQIDRDAAPPQRFGDLAPGDDAGAPAESPLHRAPPPLRTVKPRPRVVERTPEPPTGGREPGPVESTPLAPAPPRPAVTSPAPVAKATPAPAAPQAAPQAAVPAAAPAPAPAVASRPEPAAAAPVQASVSASAPAAAAPATAPRRMADPLAIPGGGEAKPVRNVAAGITGAPAPAPAPAPTAKPAAAPAQAAAPAKPADVPVAPLD